MNIKMVKKDVYKYNGVEYDTLDDAENATHRYELFEDIYNKYRAKDYFDTEIVIKNNIEIRDRGNYDKEKYNDEYIRREINEIEKRKVYNKVFMPLFEAIVNKNKEELTKRLRYDQKFSCEVFSVVTDIKINGFSNRKIKEVIYKYCWR